MDKCGCQVAFIYQLELSRIFPFLTLKYRFPCHMQNWCYMRQLWLLSVFPAYFFFPTLSLVSVFLLKCALEHGDPAAAPGWFIFPFIPWHVVTKSYEVYCIFLMLLRQVIFWFNSSLYTIFVMLNEKFMSVLLPEQGDRIVWISPTW